MAKLTPGAVLREWRRSRGPDLEPIREGSRPLSVDELGSLVERSGGQIKKIENGQRRIALPLSVQLAKLTGIPIQKLAHPEELQSACEAASLLGYRKGQAA